jgi:hypothetical protein
VCLHEGHDVIAGHDQARVLRSAANLS